MQIPNLFKQTIEDTFYDKQMEVWTAGKITDEEGAVVGNGKSEKVEDLKGNFQFSTREYIQQEYGKSIEANAIVTCGATQAKIGDIILYNAKDYYVRGKLTPDSHTTLLVYGDEGHA